jgi:uncharacterized repeat protein (TIGR01451 family)
MTTPTISITKIRTSTNIVAIGQTITYQITATSTGTISVGATVVDNPGSFLTYVSSTAPAGWTTILSGDTPTFTNTNLGTSSAVFTVTFLIGADASLDEPITNSATFTDPAAGNSPVTAATSDPLVGVADLSVVKTGPTIACNGKPITYTITVSSAGPNAAANVTLLDILPTGSKVIAFRQTFGPIFTINYNNLSTTSSSIFVNPFNNIFSRSICGNSPAIDPFANATSVSATIASFLATDVAIFQLTILPQKLQCEPCRIVTNTATVSSTTLDPNLLNNTSSITTIIKK